MKTKSRVPIPRPVATMAKQDPALAQLVTQIKGIDWSPDEQRRQEALLKLDQLAKQLDRIDARWQRLVQRIRGYRANPRRHPRTGPQDFNIMSDDPAEYAVEMIHAGRMTLAEVAAMLGMGPMQAVELLSLGEQAPLAPLGPLYAYFRQPAFRDLSINFKRRPTSQPN